MDCMWTVGGEKVKDNTNVLSGRNGKMELLLTDMVNTVIGAYFACVIK